jgi:hypothetical protein
VDWHLPAGDLGVGAGVRRMTDTWIESPEGRARNFLASLVGDLDKATFEPVPTDSEGGCFVQTIVTLEGGERFRVEVEFVDEDGR